MSRFLNGGKRKLSMIVLSSIMTLSLSYIVASASVTNDYNVNFRTTPVIDTTNVICKLNKDDEVTILDVEGDWLKATVNGVVGYIYSDYVDEGSNATVNDNGVRVRTSATTDGSNIYTKFNNGARVNVIGMENDFYTIVKDGKKLFIYSSLLSLDEGMNFGNQEVVTEEQVNEAEESAILNSTNGTVIDNSVRVRKSANTSAEIVLRLNLGDRVKFTGKSDNNWYSFYYNNEIVWICGDFVTLDEGVTLDDPQTASVLVEETVKVASVSEEVSEDEIETQNEEEEQTQEILNTTIEVGDIVYATVSNLNYRNQMSLDDASIMCKIQAGSKLAVQSVYDDWLQVQSTEGTVGYVSRAYVAKSEVQSQIINYAKTFLGISYVMGGQTPSQGFDCSGFTYYVFKHFGITLPRTSYDQAATSNGYTISRSDLMPGDLMFFITNGYSISHVGIYIGDGQFIHSQNPGIGVSISDINDTYWSNRYSKAVRIKY